MERRGRPHPPLQRKKGMPSTAIVWFRRDLRVTDNPALAAAIAEADIVVPVFVFDEALLQGRWPAPNRVWFMRESVVELATALAERGAGLRVLTGRPADVLPALVREAGRNLAVPGPRCHAVRPAP